MRFANVVNNMMETNTRTVAQCVVARPAFDSHNSIGSILGSQSAGTIVVEGSGGATTTMTHISDLFVLAANFVKCHLIPTTHQWKGFVTPYNK